MSDETPSRSPALYARTDDSHRAINPSRMEEYAPSSFDGGRTTPAAEQAVGTAAVLRPQPFVRLVYVMSLLERYSDRDCSVFLSRARRVRIGARIRRLHKIEMQSTFA
jgi:hypothetical protein